MTVATTSAATTHPERRMTVTSPRRPKPVRRTHDRKRTAAALLLVAPCFVFELVAQHHASSERSRDYDKVYRHNTAFLSKPTSLHECRRRNSSAVSPARACACDVRGDLREMFVFPPHSPGVTFWISCRHLDAILDPCRPLHSTHTQPSLHAVSYFRFLSV